MYTEAVQTCLEAKKRTTDRTMQEKLGKLAIDALERAETLKKGRYSTNSTLIID